MIFRFYFHFATVLLLVTSSTISNAQDNTTPKTKIKNSEVVNKKYEELKEITDAEMRAQAGSRSKYSIKVNATYFGGKVSDPFSKDQPVRNESPRPSLTSLSGNISAQYRVSKSESYNFGTGISAISPFHKLEKFEMNSPYLGWSEYGLWNNMQYGTFAKLSITTIPAFVEQGEVAALSFGQGGKYQINDSKLYVGADYSLFYFIFDRDFREGDSLFVSRYLVSLIPKATYKLNDKWDVSSSVALTYKNQRHQPDLVKFERNRLTGRLGVGYSVRPTIYIYPFLDFLVDDFEWDTTSLSLSATFSGF